jgi:arylformamidase
MSQEERDLGLNNGVAVGGSAEIVARWERRSTEMRARYASHLDLRYGPRERNRIDFLKAAENGPTLVFIHGGYGSIAPRKFLPCLPRDRWRMASMSC